MSLIYRVKGLNSFIKSTMKKKSEARKYVGRELNRSALRIERQAKFYAPWDTGYLSMTIYSFMESDLRAIVSAPAYYAVFVELGTRKMSAQLFLYPAVQEEFPILMSHLKKMFVK
ncbi:HK97 gp10 family phage protein [Aerococcus mictus]|uniref:HK97-gp10 family putative phage morphogenesis protein n=1 Tax=Aerococcus TaxID=1375 RepID=UPI000C78E484|nr:MULTISPECIES: HK97-gp10 family putative phage morphogenesis protein [Aerococcus]MDK6598255.1 HK97 gp10 family phage protein [Aerococcus urinae]PKY83665.1 hypothetical protein CYJ31_00925 [Aerococcus mictus]PMB93970.1 hypothetical protein CK795_00920 [Aerococcus mictus]RAV64404.1 HK97 gp10 family phage protein [Aerococcus mictus]RAV64454.1 HK97 gp10 family phage protein [Aerococcus mictus]